ncbi:MAG TPA: amidase [Polyangiaceae bacterium]|jgi:aspartyl-tRNA(Asn)/glutamyl-tRNA(Gln) amidotransferase subunit A
MNTVASTLASLTSDLSGGRCSAASLTGDALDAAEDRSGQGRTTFLRLRSATARREALASDEARKAGRTRGPLEGVPISVKDLFDVAGEVTTAGSRVLSDHAPAERHADAVDRLVQAGAIVVGATNMTEFAYSGLGLNPHYGTPAAPWRREEHRIPGGSSSGAAVSVTDSMCAAAVGTDTGGSVRIPAAFCGLVGFKPTARRVSTRGTVPLSTSLDSIGPLARSVACCALLDAVLAGERCAPIVERPAREIRLGVAREFFLDGAETAVEATFERTVSRLAAAGFQVVDLDLPELHWIVRLNSMGGLAARESWVWHHELLAAREAEYDPRVAVRIRRGGGISDKDTLSLTRERETVIRGMSPIYEGVDAILAATVAIVPPRFDALATDDEAYTAANAMVLRNTSPVNFLDGCALSVPCHREGEPPVGLMLFSGPMRDRTVLTAGHAVERALSR